MALMVLGSGGIWRRVAKPLPVSAVRVPEVACDEAGLCQRGAGDEKWNAVDVTGGNKVVARRFPKNAHLLNTSPCALEDGHHGKAVPLIENDEWAFDLASARFEMPIAETCLMDQLS